MLKTCKRIEMNKRIITITGPSGSGKDTVARILSEKTGYKLLCSYTTRPKRGGEMNGKEHFFLSECNVPHDQMLAYTRYGGYEYWTRLDQVDGTVIYVIDEDGIRDLVVHFPNMEIVPICVCADPDIRIGRGVDVARMKRDEHRILLPFDFYEHYIFNNGSLENLEKTVAEIANILTQTI